MPELTPELRELFARTKLVVLPEDYYMVRLPVDAKPLPGEWYRPATTRFATFIRDSEEITLVVPRRKWLRMHSLFETFELSKPMKVVTFDVKLALNVCGYIAAVGAVLADARISILPMSSFNRDHIVIAKEDLPRAVKVLRHFLQDCKKG
jgi:hypothetical protein